MLCIVQVPPPTSTNLSLPVLTAAAPPMATRDPPGDETTVIQADVDKDYNEGSSRGARFDTPWGVGASRRNLWNTFHPHHQPQAWCGPTRRRQRALRIRVRPLASVPNSLTNSSRERAVMSNWSI